MRNQSLFLASFASFLAFAGCARTQPSPEPSANAPQAAAPMPLLSAIASRTKAIEVGTGVIDMR